MAHGALTHLECSACGRRHDARRLQGLCGDCGRPLLARYDTRRAAGTLRRDAMAGRRGDLWRYAEMLPAPRRMASLGEGWTPLLPVPALGRELGLERLMVKDEAANPTGSFKARGLALAVNMAREHGVEQVFIPTAGNAGVATAAYAAAAGLRARVYCPADTPAGFMVAMELLGARVEKVEGLIDRCGAMAREAAAREGGFDLSTLKEPYRVEGKKTMGYELAEQLRGELPDVIIYPTGGGTGLVGMWKAFAELEELGWIGAARPRMVSVQAAGCAPMVRAFASGAEAAEPWAGAATLASGLRVPSAVGDLLILASLRASGGTALAVSDEEMVAGAALLGRKAGILAAPEGGATVAAARHLRRSGFLDGSETVVLFNTGTALSYLDALGGAVR